MAKPTTTTPSTAELPITLTVRGTTIPSTIDAARILHNETAGSPQGIAAARALGDLSHKVFVPAAGAGPISNAKPGELLFLDAWVHVQGLMEFFSNPHVQQQGAGMFSARDATVWMPARGSYSFRVQAPRGQNDRYVGMLRAPISSPEAAIESFRALVSGGVQAARRRGQLSHELYIKMAAPGDDGPLELLGLDVWTSLAGLQEHYTDKASMKGLDGIFTAAPSTSVWAEAPGSWSEW